MVVMNVASPACACGEKPSVSRVRRERQRFAASAISMEMTVLMKQLDELKACVSVLSTRLDSLHQERYPHAPPGLQLEAASTFDEMEQRLQTLEQIYVLVDWIAIESSAKQATMQTYVPTICESRAIEEFDMTVGDAVANKDANETESHSVDTDWFYDDRDGESGSFGGSSFEGREQKTSEAGGKTEKQEKMQEQEQTSSEAGGKAEKQEEEQEQTEEEIEKQTGESDKHISEGGYVWSKNRTETKIMSDTVEQWRCYHCWTDLESKTAICRYCKECTIPQMYIPRE